MKIIRHCDRQRAHNMDIIRHRQKLEDKALEFKAKCLGYGIVVVLCVITILCRIFA